MPEPANPAPGTPARRFRVFISYNHADTKWARWLMRRLEGYRVSRRFHGRQAPIGEVGPRLAPVFRDRDELPTTSDLSETIRTALRESATLVVICSPASARSRWVQEEILMFKRLHGATRVFAFIVGGEPKVAGTGDDCFSPALRFAADADGRLSASPVEVVAADARPHGDGPKLAFVRLVSGLLGVGFDELRQREQARRLRHMTFISAGSLLGMAVTLGLAAVAWQARNDARRRQNQVEDVLTFMVGDFRTELKKLGQLRLLDAVGDKATAYFDSLDARDLTDTALTRQAKALTQIGENRIDQARYPEAMRSLSAAFTRAAALAERYPNNGDMRFERAQAEYWIGFVHWKRGHLTAAGTWFLRYRDTAATLVALNPAKLAWQDELVYGEHNLAVLAMDRGQYNEARSGFLAELALLTPLSAAKPDDLPLQFRIADATSWLGSLAERAGDFGGAAARFAEQARILETLVAAEPRTTRWKVKLADALGLEASVLAITGQRTASLVHRKRARDLLDPLVAQDPSNHTWLGASLNLRLKEAQLHQAEGDGATAARLVAEARAGFEKLSRLEATDRGVSGLLATAWRIEAELRLAAGQADAADAIKRAMAIGKSLLDHDRANEGLVGDYVKAGVVAGLIAARAGDRPGSTRSAQTAVAAARPHLVNCSNWRLLDPVARAYALLGRAAESDEIVGRLSQLGYRPLEPWPSNAHP
jgi:tetratricopeptide (TPR) repeat protein